MYERQTKVLRVWLKQRTQYIVIKSAAYHLKNIAIIKEFLSKQDTSVIYFN